MVNKIVSIPGYVHLYRSLLRFYHSSENEIKESKPQQEQSAAPSVDLNALIEQLKNSPELANALASLLSGEKATVSLD